MWPRGKNNCPPLLLDVKKKYTSVVVAVALIYFEMGNWRNGNCHQERKQLNQFEKQSIEYEIYISSRL